MKIVSRVQGNKEKWEEREKTLKCVCVLYKHSLKLNKREINLKAEL